jgi:hypothetical protein
MAITNELVLCVFGIQRSGNHAIIPWILENVEGARVHLNDIRRMDPYVDFNGMTVYGLSYYTCGRKWRGLNRHILSSRRHAGAQLGRLADGNRELDIGRIRRAHKNLLVLSYEDVFLNDARVRRFLADPTKAIGASRRRLQVLILRDPYNHFASLLKYEASFNSPSHLTLKLYAQMWKQYAAVFAGDSTMVDTEYLCVNYNQWCESSDYRRDLAQTIGFATDGRPFNQVSSVGGGSSFQGVIDDARNLGVNERWRAFMHDTFYRSLFDEQIAAYGERLFKMRREEIFGC